MTWRVADLLDRAEDFATAASQAELFASEAAVTRGRRALTGVSAF